MSVAACVQVILEEMKEKLNSQLGFTFRFVL